MDTTSFQCYCHAWPEAMLLLDTGGAVRSANAAARHLLETAQADLIGSSLLDLVDHGSAPLQGYVSTWCNSRDVVQYSLTLRLSSGTTRDYLAQGFGLGDGRAAVVRFTTGAVRAANFRLLNRRLDSQRRVLQRLRESREALINEHAKALVTLNSVSDAVITTSQQGCIEWLNPMAESLTGWSCGEALGRPLKDVFNIIDETSGELVVDSVTTCLEEDRVVKLLGQVQLISRDGTEYVVEVSATPMHAKNGNVSGAVVIFRDLTSVRNDKRQLEYLTHYDQLSGLYNRQHFEQQLEQAVLRTRRSGDTHAMLFIDLDQFKLVNEISGHQEGDELLIGAAELFERRLRGGDILARLGGDQYAVLLNKVTRPQALRAAESFRAALDNFYFRYGGEQLAVTASIGVAMIDAAIGSSADVLKQAELACTLAKQGGRNRCRALGGAEEAGYSEAAMLGTIRAALAEGLFELHYQPVVDARDGRVEFYEVLLRMRAKNGAVFLPSTFMPTAERQGLMPQLDHWALHRILSVMKERQNSGAAACDFALNLSASSLHDEKTLDVLRLALATTEIEPRRLILEVAEKDIAADIPAATAFIRTVRDIGCRVVLDGFNAGFGALAYLKALPVDYVKINGAVLEEAMTDPAMRAAVDTVVRLVGEQGKKTIVGFIENASSRLHWDDTGIGLLQGYGIARPTAEPAEAA